MMGHSDRPSFITGQRRFNHHGGGRTRAPSLKGFVSEPEPTTPISPALRLGRSVEPSAVVVRIEGVLADLVQPADYVRWEYLSRQRLLATEIASFREDRKSTRLNSSHPSISYAVFCLKKKKIQESHFRDKKKNYIMRIYV